MLTTIIILIALLLCASAWYHSVMFRAGLKLDNTPHRGVKGVGVGPMLTIRFVIADTHDGELIYSVNKEWKPWYGDVRCYEVVTNMNSFYIGTMGADAEAVLMDLQHDLADDGEIVEDIFTVAKRVG